MTASGGAPLVVSDAAADPRVAGLPPVASGAVSAYLGVPLRTAEDITVGALCVFDSAPRTWSAYDVALLEELGGSVMAELELAALAVEYETSRVRWDTALEAAGIGGFDWDLRTDLVEWDERMQALFGYSPGEYLPQISEAFSRIHADDRPSVDAAIAEALESCGDYRAEFRVVLPEGQQRWVAARGRAVPGVDGSAAQLLGTAHDISEARSARDQAAHVLATMATGFLSVDRDWSVTYLNATGERVLGLRADELVGRTLWQAFPGLEDLEFGERYRGAMQTGEPIGFEAHYPHLDSWYEVRAVPGPEGLHVYFLDITARHADQKRAAAAAGRLELLATVSAELAKTLEVKGAVARLARLVVPALGDWCVVTLVEDDGPAQDVGWFHREPALQPLVQHYAERRLDALTTSSFVAQARRTGQPVLVAQGATDAIGEVLTAGQARDVFVALAPESAAILPLRARGRTLGLLTVFRGKDRPRLDEDDFATAREVASRAGLALDNARLYDLQRRLTEGLQRSLLTAPPEPDHCEIVVRYAPAAQFASVGGDWFDAFLQADGATMLVIGDVVGHDTEAAAAMGQVRVAARHRLVQRGGSRRGALRARRGDGGAPGGHHRHRRRGPPGADRRRAVAGADAAAMVERRPSPADGRTARRHRLGVERSGRQSAARHRCWHAAGGVPGGSGPWLDRTALHRWALRAPRRKPGRGAGAAAQHPGRAIGPAAGGHVRHPACAHAAGTARGRRGPGRGAPAPPGRAPAG